jgi:hypothetical protein
VGGQGAGGPWIVAAAEDETSKSSRQADSAVLFIGYAILADQVPGCWEEKLERVDALLLVARFLVADVVVQTLGA